MLFSIFSVLFDSEFSGGLAIRSNSNRSYRLPGSALINLTHGRERSQQSTGQQQQPGRYGGNTRPVARVKPMGTPPRNSAPRRQQSQEGPNMPSNLKQSNSATKIEAGFCPSVAPPDPKMLPNPAELFGAKNVQSHPQPPQPTRGFGQVKTNFLCCKFLLIFGAVRFHTYS